jgi:hypothetical protein
MQNFLTESDSGFEILGGFFFSVLSTIHNATVTDILLNLVSNIINFFISFLSWDH